MAQAFIPPKTAKLITDLGLSESTVIDVFNHGEQRQGQTKMVKKYRDYTVQVTYTQSDKGEYVITWVSKW